MNQRLLLSLLVFASFSAIVSCTKNAALNSTNNVSPSTSTFNSTNPSNTGGNCLITGQEISKDSLPAVITNYLQNNLPNEKIDDAELYNDNGVITYEVELKNETILILDATGNLLAQGQETELMPADIPQVIKDLIATDYSAETIEEAKKEWTYQGQEVINVELASELNLLFDLNGNLLCSEQDLTDSNDHNGTPDSDTDETIDTDSDADDGTDTDSDADEDDGIDTDIAIPAEIKVLVEGYLATNFPGYTLKEAELDSLCNGTPAVVATLKDANGLSLDAYFALDINITLLQTSTKILSTNLPVAVTDAINTAYPNLLLEADARQIELPDGNLQYEVEVENTTNNTERTLILSADGTVVCEE